MGVFWGAGAITYHQAVAPLCGKTSNLYWQLKASESSLAHK
jgi:hypothetical protein